MKKIAICIVMAVFVVLAASLVNAELRHITAEEAFDAQASQVDPESGDSANVIIVDIRSAAEYYWVGAPAKVDEIITKRSIIVPDDGKVNVFGRGNNLLRFKVNGNFRVLSAKSALEIEMSSIAMNIPYKTWDKILISGFEDDINALADGSKNTSIILMCRSGKRTTEAYTDFETTFTTLFKAVYEIDQPDGKNGRGGFQGTSYDDAYNGYRGFPERKTSFKSHESVSWSDAGLPIHIGWGI